MTNKTQYTAIIVVSSTGDSNDTEVSVEWNPELTGEDIEELGFMPGSFKFVEDYILPALERAYEESDYAELESIERRPVN